MGLIKNTSFYSFGAILPKIGSFVFLPIYLKYLTPADYGVINSLMVLNAVLVVLFTLSMPRALYRIYYDYEGESDKKALIGTVFISVFVIASISLTMIFLFRNQVQKIYESISFFPYFAYAVLIVFFQAFQVIPTILLQIKEKATTFVSLSVSLFFLKSILILWFITVQDKGVEGYLKGELIAVIVFIPVYYSFIYRDFSLNWNLKFFKNVFSFSLPIIPGVLSAWILNLSDRIFIERYFSTAEVGIYSLGYQIAGLVLIFSLAFKKAYDPYFYKIANIKDREVAKKKLYKTNYVFIVVISLACFFISFFSKEGIMLFFDEKYYAAINIIPIISLAYLVSQNSALLNVMMYQEKKTKVVMYITIFSALINICLNYVLIPIMGIFGAAWATLISFLTVFVFSYFLAKKAFFIPYNWKGIIPLLFGLIVVYFIFHSLQLESIYLSLAIKLITIFVIGLVVFLKYRTIIYSVVKGT